MWAEAPLIPATTEPTWDTVFAAKSPEKLSVSAVPLEEATTVFQPVTGTSAGSVYHTIAIGPDAKMAVRILANNDIAIRVLPLNGNGRAACAAAGLTDKKKGHWSLHLHPQDKSLVNTSIGAVLFALDLQWTALATNMSKLVGAGA